MLSKRQLEVLSLIIQQFTSEGRAIGSKAIMAHGINASSATIRNDMAKLETLGLIAKEHTSSGRIPTMHGYRYYVDYLIHPTAVSPEVSEWIEKSFKQNFHSVGEMIQLAANLLEEITHYTALVSAEEVGNNKLSVVNCFKMNKRQVLFSIVLDNGAIYQKTIYLESGISEQGLVQLMQLIQEHLVAREFSEIYFKLKMNFPQMMHQYFTEPQRYLHLLEEIFEEVFKRNFYVGGRLNLLNFLSIEKVDDLKQLYRLFSSDEEIEKILDFNQIPENIQISIGADNKHPLLQELTLVKVPYQIENGGKAMITLLGPPNMNYEEVVGLMEEIRKHLVERMNEYYRYIRTMQ